MVRYSLLHTVTHCGTLPHIITRCYALLHTATHCHARPHNGCQVGFGPIAWLMMSEVFPLRTRTLALSAAILVNFGFNLVATFTLPSLQARPSPVAPRPSPVAPCPSPVASASASTSTSAPALLSCSPWGSLPLSRLSSPKLGPAVAAGDRRRRSTVTSHPSRHRDCRKRSTPSRRVRAWPTSSRSTRRSASSPASSSSATCPRPRARPSSRSRRSSVPATGRRRPSHRRPTSSEARAAPPMPHRRRDRDEIAMRSPSGMRGPRRRDAVLTCPLRCVRDV